MRSQNVDNFIALVLMPWGRIMKRIDRFLFSRGFGWEMTRLLVVLIPVSAFLLLAWWLAQSAA